MIKEIEISKLTLLEDNPRSISKENMAKLKRSITKFRHFLFKRPLLVNKIDDKYIVYAGNQKLTAAGQLEWETIPCRIDEGMTEEEMIEEGLLDNTSHGDWLMEMLASEKFKVAVQSVDIPGIKIEELFPEEVPEEESIPQIQKEVISVLGDLYELNGHRVLCGDSTKIDDVEKLMNGEKADMVFTDPPYGLLDHKIETGIDYVLMFNMLREILKNNSFLTFTSQQPMLSEWTVIAQKLEFNYKNEIIWNKKQPSCGYAKIGRQHENIMILSKGEKDYINNKISFDDWLEGVDYNKLEGIKRELSFWKSKANGKKCKGADYYKKNRIKNNLKKSDSYYKGFNQQKGGGLGVEEKTISTIWDITRDSACITKKEDRQESLHVTQKPVKMIKRLIKMCSKKGELTIDTFLGSGSTLIACEQTNRKCYGIELDPKYIDVILRRWVKYQHENDRPIQIKRNGVECDYKEWLEEAN